MEALLLCGNRPGLLERALVVPVAPDYPTDLSVITVPKREENWAASCGNPAGSNPLILFVAAYSRLFAPRALWAGMENQLVFHCQRVSSPALARPNFCLEAKALRLLVHCGVR